MVWAMMVFLLKVKGGYRGIELVEVVWKVCAMVLNFRLNWGMTLHDVLHGFRAGMGAGTVTLEEILARQLVGIAHEPLL